MDYFIELLFSGLTRGAKAVWKRIDGTKLMQKKQPKWQSDHYFYAAAVRLK